MENKDEDIKILKEFTESSCCLYGQEEIIEATKNVLSRLEKNKDIEQDYITNEEKIADYTSKLETELETYKKIAEKLARLLKDKVSLYDDICINISDEKCADNKCYDCVIDWARKEVENDDN